MPQNALQCGLGKSLLGKRMGVGINYKMSQVTLVDQESYEVNFEHLNTKWRLQQVQFGENMISSVVHESYQKL